MAYLQPERNPKIAKENRISRDTVIYLVILLAYAAVVTLAILTHEPFTDEGQAWLIARDSSLPHLLFTDLRYNGHPMLWYLLLLTPAKLGAPYITVNIISAILGIIATFLFLKYSPFPMWAKVIFPFSYFMIFQYSVVGRTYSLAPILLFSIAIIYKKKTERVWLFILLLSLLANVQLHCTLVATGILVVHIIDVYRERKLVDRKTLRKNILAIGVFWIAFFLFVVLLLWPPEYTTNKVTINLSPGQFWAAFEGFLNGPITNYWFVTIPVLLVSLVWFWHRKVFLLYVLPTIFHFTLITVYPTSVFNMGIFFIVWIFVLWVSLLDYEKVHDSTRDKLRLAALGVLAIVLAIQVWWGVGAITYGIGHEYCGTEGVADFIKSNDLEDKTIYMVGQSCTGVNPYFTRNIFKNYHEGKESSYWLYSIRNTTPEKLNDATRKQIEEDRPYIVVVSLGAVDSDDEMIKFAEESGYEIYGPFVGDMVWKERRGPVRFYSYLILVSKGA